MYAARKNRVVKTKSENKSFSQIIRDKAATLKFLLIFGALIGIYYIASLLEFMQPAFRFYRIVATEISVVILSFFDSSVTSEMYTISSPDYQIHVGLGCEGSEPLALFLSLVIAFPVNFKFKLPGILLGGIIIYLLNIIRIVALYYAGTIDPDSVEMLHHDIFPYLIAFISVILSIIWIRWAIAKAKK